jgi:glycosyltransferase involved in cell wall biosynthesis
MSTTPELSIVLPCLNEAKTVARCIAKARGYLQRAGVTGEVVVADNGSTDGSRELAAQAGARVIAVPERGYGAALIAGIRAARGRYVVMGDADDSYDFSALDAFLAKLREGYQLVMGNRFRGGILPGAMPALHRYLGNPVLSFLGRIFFRVPAGDFHCGLRAFDRQAILKLDLCTPGMEFASEMVVKASLAQMRIAEVPTTLSPDGRDRPPHLRSWRDGWRHLRFLLMFSPRWLFLYPGLALLAAGLAAQALLYPGPRYVGGVGLDIHTMLYAAAASIIGFQMIWFAVFSKAAGIRAGLFPADRRMSRLLEIFSLERGLVLGALLFLGALAMAAWPVLSWERSGFGPLDPTITMRLAIPAVTLMILGMEVFIAAFFLSILALKPRAVSA